MKSFDLRTVLLATLLVIAVAGIPAAQAYDWEKLGEYQASGGATEVTVNLPVARCFIKCIEEPVTINTFVVREGEKKTPIKVVTKMTKGQELPIDIGAKRQITGFRISNDGGGKYQVWVKD
jgi:hypothetical protein